MSAPAVPTNQSGSVAPTTKIESTQAAPHGQSVSAIGHEGAGPEEAMLHSGAWNSIDLALRMQFIALATVRWTVDQAPGTLLWSTPISPKHSHQFLRHLQKMYNTWVGGLEYNVKICGTGFHAGALACVRLPPNIKPNTVTASADFTAFEYVIIDPKTLEVVSEHIIDQRRVMYHYNDDESYDAIGGYFAIYVLVPLATSSTGNQSISIQILTRPSSQFNFFQLRPLGEETNPPVDDTPEFVVQTLGMSDCTNGTALFDTEIQSYMVAPKTQATPLNVSSIGVYSFDGSYKGPENTQELGILNQVGYVDATYSVETSNGPIYLLIPKLKLPKAASFSIDLAYKYNNRWESPTTSPVIVEPGKYRIASSGGTTQETAVKVLYKIEQYKEDKPVTLPKQSDESFFLFQNYKTSGGVTALQSYQTEQLAKVCKSAKAKDLFSPQEAMIIDMYDTELDVPVRRLKVYYTGQVTTKGEDDVIELPANKYSFRFVQYSRVSEPIPAPIQNHKFNSIISEFAQLTQKQRANVN